jgi:MtfA peptidase
MRLWWPFRRRAPAPHAPLPAAWRERLDALPFVAALPPARRARFDERVRRFVEEKSWEGCAGLVVTDEMKVAVAAHAVLLALELPDGAYRSVRSILVYPSAFVNPTGRVDEHGIVHEGMGQAGEAWHGRGPVIVSWDSARSSVAQSSDGYNVLFHEFAHKLDLLDGWADGTPPLVRRADYEAWTTVMTREHEEHRRAVSSGRRTLLDPYAATDPAEFFAVATEVFFERPLALREAHPDVYARLVAFYRQDPASLVVPGSG